MGIGCGHTKCRFTSPTSGMLFWIDKISNVALKFALRYGITSSEHVIYGQRRFCRSCWKFGTCMRFNSRVLKTAPESNVFFFRGEITIKKTDYALHNREWFPKQQQHYSQGLCCGDKKVLLTFFVVGRFIVFLRVLILNPSNFQGIGFFINECSVRVILCPFSVVFLTYNCSIHF